MNFFKGDTKSCQEHSEREHFFNQIKNMITNSVSTNNSSFVDLKAIKMPVKMVQNISPSHRQATFMALVDAMVPSTLGALDLRLDDYLIWSLDNLVAIQGEWGIKDVPLSTPTAAMLDIAAFQLTVSGKMNAIPNFTVYPDGGLFAALSAVDRFEAIRLLENQQVDLEALPSPYRNNTGLVENIVTILHQIIINGYYSEWFSFGSTRLAYPEDRVVERQPFIWDTMNYPGASHGYRAIKIFRE